MTASIRPAKPKSAARPRSVAGGLAHEEKMLRIEEEWSLAAARGVSPGGFDAGAHAVEDGETLDLIGGLLDGLTIEVANLNEELSSSMKRLSGKQRDGVRR
jgi:hypothetical protein